MLIGPVFGRELAAAPRSWRLYATRAVYVAGLFLIVCTTFLAFHTSQERLTLGDYARFGAFLFQLLARLQLVVLTFFAALSAAAAVAHEKDRRTLELLLMTRLTNSELVLGKLFASLLRVLMVLAAALPLFMLVSLFGGVSVAQIARVFAVTLGTVLAAGSLGGLVALWREKTFQSLALTTMALAAWLALGEVIAAGFFGAAWRGVESGEWAAALTPWRAVLAATQPFFRREFHLGFARDAVELFSGASLAVAVFCNVVGVWRVRAWSSSRTEQGPRVDDQEATIFTASTATTSKLNVAAARTLPSREVWDNPILWREMRTWAYGTRMLLIRVAYLAMFAAAAFAVHEAVAAAGEQPGRAAIGTPLVLLFVLSLVLVNAQAVTAITSERDARALDLLLVTDLTPVEIICGKFGGALYNTKEMVLLPLALCAYAWSTGAIGLENLLFLFIGLAVLNLFAAMLGIHSGMNYGNSLAAVSVSLGTVFFLCVGVWVSMQILVAFRGSLMNQFAMFFFMFVFGGMGLYAAHGWRNPSTALAIALGLAPFATFYAITSFELRDMLAVFLTAVVTYGFATAAMLIPAIYEFDIATGRTTGGDGGE